MTDKEYEDIKLTIRKIKKNPKKAKVIRGICEVLVSICPFFVGFCGLEAFFSYEKGNQVQFWYNLLLSLANILGIIVASKFYSRYRIANTYINVSKELNEKDDIGEEIENQKSK